MILINRIDDYIIFKIFLNDVDPTKTDYLVPQSRTHNIYYVPT